MKKKYIIISIIAIGSLLVLGGALFAYSRFNNNRSLVSNQNNVGIDSWLDNPDDIFESAEVISRGDTILVDIGGAVLRPGIYELEAGSVVADVINSAGGFAPDANREYLNRVLNLAVELTSAQKLYIPYSGEVINRVENGSADSSTTASGNSGLISINNASQRELQTLTGIGEVRAQAIIDGRPYSSIDDLLTRRVLTEGIFRNIRDEIDL